MENPIKNKYADGKIYLITDLRRTKVYYGSTIQKLSKRMTKHRNDYKMFKKKEYGANISSYQLFDEFGLENCIIELVTNYPCNSKEELNRKEGEFIRNNVCVNKVIAGRTRTEYNSDPINKEKAVQRAGLYYAKNKEAVNEKRRNNDEIKLKAREYRAKNIDRLKLEWKTYREENQELVKLRTKKWRDANPEKVKELRLKAKSENITITCDCGSQIQKSEKNRHLKTVKHTKFRASGEAEAQPTIC